MRDIVMPKLNLTMEEGTVIRWAKKEGDPVEKGEVLLEVETDKAVNEVEAFYGGVLGKILHGEGDIVKVLTVIGYLLEPGEEAPSIWPDVAPSDSVAPQRTATRQPVRSIAATSIAENTGRQHGLHPSMLSGSDEVGEATEEDVLHDLRQTQTTTEPAPAKIIASPRATMLARAKGIRLDSIRGSGPNGRILETDVQSLVDSQDLIVPSRAQQITARRLTESFSTVPHFYLRVEVLAGQLVDARHALLSVAKDTDAERPTYTDLLVFLTARALSSHPFVNAAWADGSIRLQKAVNMGVAMAGEVGLVVPVIRNADKKSLAEITSERRRLSERASEGRLHLADLEDGTFTITNLGMFGIDDFDAIINPPQSAILAVGQIADRVVTIARQARVAPSLRLSLAIDHRVLDGATAARFLTHLKDMIEQSQRIFREAGGTL